MLTPCYHSSSTTELGATTIVLSPQSYSQCLQIIFSFCTQFCVVLLGRGWRGGGLPSGFLTTRKCFTEWDRSARFASYLVLHWGFSSSIKLSGIHHSLLLVISSMLCIGGNWLSNIIFSQARRALFPCKASLNELTAPRRSWLFTVQSPQFCPSASRWFEEFKRRNVTVTRNLLLMATDHDQATKLSKSKVWHKLPTAPLNVSLL